MPSREPEIVRQLWREHYEEHGALMHEFPLLEPGLTPLARGYKLIPRRTDAVLLPDWPERTEITFRKLGQPFDDIPVIRHPAERLEWQRAVKGQNAVVIQAKEHRVGPGVLGQTVCSAALVSVWAPAVIHAVAAVTATDEKLVATARTVPELAVTDVDIDADAFTRPNMLSTHRGVITALLEAFATVEVVPLEHPTRPYRQTLEPRHPHVEIEDWYLTEHLRRAPDDRKLLRPFHFGAHHCAPLLVITHSLRRDSLTGAAATAVHSYKNPDGAMMTLPLIGQAVVTEPLLKRQTPLATVRSVLLCERLNGGLLPLLVPFPWIELVSRSPSTSGSAAELLARALRS